MQEILKRTLWIQLVLVTIGLTMVYPSLAAQPPAADEYPTGEIDAEGEPINPGGGGDAPLADRVAADQVHAQFEAMREKLRQNQERIGFLFRTMPIGFAERKKERMAEIDRLKAENEQLKMGIYQTAMEAYLVNDNPVAEKIVESELKARLGSDDLNIRPFDPSGALEITTAMINRGKSSLGVLFYAFRANFALERFDKASELLEKIATLNPAFGDAIRPRLEDAKEKWQRELTIRRWEAATDDLPRVKLVTSEGDIVVELFENHAPNTVANFIYLIESQQFYDNKLFHLVKPGQYVQTGSPRDNGIGNAGYKIPCECFRDQIRHHFRGSLSMVTAGRDRGGSQFIITHQPNPIWDATYTVFGRVIEGMDVVFKIHAVDLTMPSGNATSASKLISAEVLRKRNHEYVPVKVGDPGADDLDATDSEMQTSMPEAIDDQPEVVQEMTPEGAAKDELLDDPGTFDLLLRE